MCKFTFNVYLLKSQATPSPLSYHPTPSPADYTSPLTPGGGYSTPGSVGSVLDHPINTEWQTVDIVVAIKDSHDDSLLIGKQGVIRTMTVSSYLIYF